MEPVEELFRRAGFRRVHTRHVPELADPANGDAPPYVLVAS